jgi:hypothetical protein
MTAASRAAGDAVRADLYEQFVDLIYGDRDLLDEEFAAIVAAAWSDPATVPPAGGEDAVPTAPSSVHLGRTQPRQHRPSGTRTLGERSRQRSPPHPRRQRMTRKAGDHHT